MSTHPEAPDVSLLLAEVGWLRRLARGLVADGQAADDVVQETLLAALRRPPRSDRPLRPWLARVAKNFVRMRRRSEASRGAREERAARSERAPDTTELVERTELQRRLARCVTELPEPYRSTVLLRYFEGLNSAQIAARFGVAQGTVRWRLMHALELLRCRLDQDHDGDRRAWSALLAPLAGAARGAPLAPGGSGPALALRVAGACAAALTFAWIGWYATGARGPEELPAGAARSQPPRVAADAVAGAGAARRGADALPTAAGAPATGRVRVVDAAGRPAAGARLELHPPTGAPRALPVDAKGAAAWSFDAPDGHTALWSLVLGGADWVARTVRFRQPPAGALDLGRVALQRAGRVVGRALDAEGAPLAGAVVRVEPLPSRWWRARGEPLGEAAVYAALLPDPAAWARTDAAGLYRVDGLAPGFVRVWVGAEEHYEAWSAPGVVEAGETTWIADLAPRAASPGEMLVGRVLGADGTPVAGAEVEVARSSARARFFAGEPFVARTRADADGRFRVAAGPFPRHDVAARAPVPPGVQSAGSGALLRRVRAGREPLVLRLGPPASDARAQAPPAAAPAAPPGAPVRLRCARDGAPLAGARVALLRALPDGLWATAGEPTRDGATWLARALPGAPVGGPGVTDDDGEVLLSPPDDGPWIVRLAAPTGVTWAPLPGCDAADVGRPVELEFPPFGSLAGVVSGPDGAPAAGVVVGASNGLGDVFTERSDGRGAFRFERLAPGSWQVAALDSELSAADPTRLAIHEARVAAAGCPGGVQVTAGARARAELTLGAPAHPRVVGTLALDGAAPGPWVAALIDRSGGAPPRFSGVGPDGRFRLDAPAPGAFELRLWDQPREGPQTVIVERLELAGGARIVDVRYDTAPLTIDGLDGRGAGPGGLAVLWEDGPDRWGCVHLFALDRRSLQLPRVRAGALRVVRLPLRATNQAPFGPHDEPDPRAAPTLATAATVAGRPGRVALEASDL